MLFRGKDAIQREGGFGESGWKAERAVKLTSPNAVCVLTIPGEPCTGQDIGQGKAGGGSQCCGVMQAAH